MNVKAKIDGRAVEAVIVTHPCAEAARAFRRLAEVMRYLPRLEDPVE